MTSHSENAYRAFFEKTQTYSFVQIICTNREIEYFTALFALLEIFEKKIINYEVLWDIESNYIPNAFSVFIGEPEEKISAGALITKKKIHVPKGVILIQEPQLENLVLNLCKYAGHPVSDILWALCISTYACSKVAERGEWNKCIKEKEQWTEKDTESQDKWSTDEEDESTTTETKISQSSESRNPILRIIDIEIERLGGQQEERRIVEKKHEIYFPFAKWTAFYTSLLNDMGVSEQLGLFFKRKKAYTNLLSVPEYELNRFLASLGISAVCAKSSTMYSLPSLVQKTVQQVFLPRCIYIKHYEYNMGITHVEAFFCICSLIRKKRYAEAVLAFKSVLHIDIQQGQNEYTKMALMVQEGLTRRRVLNMHDKKTILIPKSVLIFSSLDEISMMKEVFLNIYGLCKSRDATREVIMIASVISMSIYRVFYRKDQKIHWIDTKEIYLMQKIDDIIQDDKSR